jgi:hypothetical protein
LEERIPWLPVYGGIVTLILSRIMKRSYKNIITAVVLGLSMTACQDWVKPESLEVSVKNNGGDDPALREQYLKNLRSYKESDHQLVYISFDNAAESALNATTLVSYLPDSVDVVELTNPVLRDWFAADMKEVQEDYGTRFVLRVSYDDIMAPYGNAPGQTPVTEEEKTEIIATAVDSLLRQVDVFGYDGITVQYNGLFPDYLYADELAALTKKENDFLPLIKAWKEQNPDKTLFFKGVPTRTIDHSVPLAAEAIIIPTVDARSVNYADFEARNGANGDFAGARMILETMSIPNDPLDKSTGRYTEGEHIPMMLEWMTTNVPDKYTLAGICVYHAEWGCLSTSGYYPVLKNVIKTLNPNS